MSARLHPKCGTKAAKTILDILSKPPLQCSLIPLQWGPNLTSYTRTLSFAVLAIALVGGCATTVSPAIPATAPVAKAKAVPKIVPKGMTGSGLPDSFPSTYKPLPSVMTAIVGATILTAAGQEIENGTILFAEGKIVAVGSNVVIPEGAKRID